jgi:hypothetical protein
LATRCHESIIVQEYISHRDGSETRVLELISHAWLISSNLALAFDHKYTRVHGEVRIVLIAQIHR